MIKIEKKYCPENHKCPTIRVCPVGAIIQDGVKAPTINHDLCTDCGRCVRACRVFKKA